MILHVVGSRDPSPNRIRALASERGPGLSDVEVFREHFRFERMLRIDASLARKTDRGKEAVRETGQDHARRDDELPQASAILRDAVRNPPLV